MKNSYNGLIGLALFIGGLVSVIASTHVYDFILMAVLSAIGVFGICLGALRLLRFASQGEVAVDERLR